MAAAASAVSGTVLSTPATFNRPLTGQPRVGQVLFGVKPMRGKLTTMSATYKVKLETPSGPVEFNCDDDVYILDQAEEEGVELPYSCRAGSCSSCCGKVVSGTIDQSEQSFLDDDQMGDGYVLTCIAYPQSDVVIQTHKEDDLS